MKCINISKISDFMQKCGTIVYITKQEGAENMAQLWGGRFTKEETDQLVYNFNASISFDKRFYAQDITGSIAHVTMLAKQGILSARGKKKRLLMD